MSLFFCQGPGTVIVHDAVIWAPNVPGIHEEKTAPSAKDPGAAAAGAAQERLSSKF